MSSTEHLPVDDGQHEHEAHVADVVAHPFAVDAVAFRAFVDPSVGGEDVVDVAAGNAARAGVRVLAVEVKDGVDRGPGKVVPAEFAHPGLILSSADRREGDAADGIRPEDVPPDKDRPAAPIAGDQGRTVSAGPDGLRCVRYRLEGWLAPEAFKSEAEAIDARRFNGRDCGFEGLRMEDVVLIGKHQVGGRDSGEGCVSRGATTAVRLVDDEDAVVSLRIALENREGIVSRSVVDADAGPVP